MSGQLIPPPELDPPMNRHLDQKQRVWLWLDLMNTVEHFHMAGLRHKVGPVGDLQAAYRDWYRTWAEEHDQAMQHMIEGLAGAEERHGH